MRVLFCTSKLPGAVLIRAITWSDWSHVALIDGEEAIEATWPAVRVAPCRGSLCAVIGKRPTAGFVWSWSPGHSRKAGRPCSVRKPSTVSPLNTFG